ncbi:hypothetical protein F929_02758 [Acinetobacter lactucae]|uniref:Uncharacterized protein n=1 Tax=Acinetobacter lactucae TaxID=1785128 RepID=R8YTW4_9GAMM|nr:hypothetical protein F929_02758 [Acinetobacter lactucae]
MTIKYIELWVVVIVLNPHPYNSYLSQIMTIF